MKAFTNQGGGVTLVLDRREAIELDATASGARRFYPKGSIGDLSLRELHWALAPQVSKPKNRKRGYEELFSALDKWPLRITRRDYEEIRRIGWEAW